ncbi:hypothetical protein [Streptomyces sp. NPDC051636]|uniref:hypothetical protein n=1 Tax=Streptomyces sp. NPDC051636 TaxID=3365663 RepID=UPI00378E3A7A
MNGLQAHQEAAGHLAPLGNVTGAALVRRRSLDQLIALQLTIILGSPIHAIRPLPES